MNACTYVLFIGLLLLSVQCQSVTTPEPAETGTSSPVIVYTNIGEWYSKINVIENDAKRILFPDDTVTRSYADLNLKRKKIVYMHNCAVYPMMGEVGNPSVCVSDMQGTTEKTLLPFNVSVNYFYPIWVSEKEFAVFKKTGTENLTVVIIDTETGTPGCEITINFNGDIYSCMMEKTTESLVFLQCGYRYLAAIDIGLKTILKDTVIASDDEAFPLTRPLLSDGNIFYFTASRFPFSYLTYNADNNTFAGYTFPVNSVDVSAITDENFITYDHDPWGNSLLMKCDRKFNVENSFRLNIEGVIYYKDNSVYCLAEGNDAYAVIKVDFTDSSYTLLNDPIEDNFILDARAYE